MKWKFFERDKKTKELKKKRKKFTMKCSERFPLKYEIFFKIISIYKYELTDDGDSLSYGGWNLYDRKVC